MLNIEKLTPENFELLRTSKSTNKKIVGSATYDIINNSEYSKEFNYK